MFNETDNEAIDAQFDRIAEALLKLQPNPQRAKVELFRKLYPLIVERLKAKVSQKAILEMLQAHGLKLHPSRFKELMDAEAAARAPNATQADAGEEAQ